MSGRSIPCKLRVVYSDECTCSLVHSCLHPCRCGSDDSENEMMIDLCTSSDDSGDKNEDGEEDESEEEEEEEGRDSAAEDEDFDPDGESDEENMTAGALHGWTLRISTNHTFKRCTQQGAAPIGICHAAHLPIPAVRCTSHQAL